MERVPSLVDYAAACRQAVCGTSPGAPAVGLHTPYGGLIILEPAVRDKRLAAARSPAQDSPCGGEGPSSLSVSHPPASARKGPGCSSPFLAFGCPGVRLPEGRFPASAPLFLEILAPVRSASVDVGEAVLGPIPTSCKRLRFRRHVPDPPAPPPPGPRRRGSRSDRSGDLSSQHPASWPRSRRSSRASPRAQVPRSHGQGGHVMGRSSSAIAGPGG